MNSLINEFIKLFIDTTNPQIKETFEYVKIEASSLILRFPDWNEISILLDRFRDGDIIQIQLIIDDNEAILFNSSQNDQFAEFIDDAKRKYEIKIEGTFVTLIFEIYKKEGNIKSVYNGDTFIKYLSQLPMQELLSVFRNIQGAENLICFTFTEGNINIQTSLFSFLSNSNKKVELISSKRKERLEQINNLCHSNLYNNNTFLAEDFDIIIDNNSIPQLTKLFSFLKLIYSLTSIFDIAQLIGNVLDYKLNGFKSHSGKIELERLDLKSSNLYFNIYNWIYNEGNQVDKIGLARNILTLHLNIDNLGIGETVFPSIKSSHNVYLKQNIKQYTEIRNKVTDQLLEFHNKADKIVENFANDFKKSLLAFLSFFASVIIIQVLKNGNFNSVFSLDATLLSMAFIVVMALFLGASCWELNEQRKRYRMMYESMKKRTKDLLDDTDVDKILDNDSYFNKEFSFLKEKGTMYTIVWILTIIIFFIIVIFLFIFNSLNQAIYPLFEFLISL